MLMLLSNEILFTGGYFVTFTIVLFIVIYFVFYYSVVCMCVFYMYVTYHVTYHIGYGLTSISSTQQGHMAPWTGPRRSPFGCSWPFL